MTSASGPSPDGGKSRRPALLSLADFERAASNLRPAAADYLNGGACDEITVSWNHERYAGYSLLPRCCVDVSRLDTRLDLLGTQLDFPVLLSPTASHRLFHPEAEAATARGATSAGALWVASTMASRPIGELGALATGPLWFQLYIQRDRALTVKLVERAATAGARAIVLTVDTPVNGRRERDLRNGLAMRHSWRPANLCDLGRVELDPAGIYDPCLDPAATWKTVGWLAAETSLPIVVKGVLRADDARRAVDCGAAAVMVSNHGGRNLDTAIATVDALPAVAAAVGNQVPVIVDGGIRRGTDVVKALALGATAVGIGRPYLWGLAVAGDDGVRQVVELLRRELEIAMALLGAPALADITLDLVHPAHAPTEAIPVPR